MQEAVQIKVSINADLHEDLVLQATACELSAQRYIEELVECAIAERRFAEQTEIQPQAVQPRISSIYRLGW